MKRLLILEDGSVYEGEGFGSSRYQMGELVFNTGMSGYQEVLSDLSYCGQIVMMTYPMIGNYGINCDDFESLDPAVFGFVVRECCEAPSNFRSDYTLDEFLKQKDIPGISGVDTRAITRKLRNSGTMRAKEILAMKPDGVMLSNGPGDPKDVPVAIETIRELMGQVVIFGICLGHQLISLASGANTVKLKFGHRGCNHPVMNLANGKVEMTSQNHGYAVEEASLKDTDLVMTHQALNDKSVEGVRHSKYPIFSVQYHPEASPGPEDSNYLFDQFMELMEKEAVKR